MKEKITMISFIVLIFTIQDIENNNNNFLKKSDDSLIKNLFERYLKALEFFDEDSLNVNLDGLLALRMSQGQFIKLLSISTKPNQTQLINSINKRLTNLTLKINDNIKIKTPEYYFEFKSLISFPFILDYDNNHLNLNIILVKNESKNAYLNDRFSDLSMSNICLSLLINSNQSNECNTNDKCMDFLIETKSSGYYLTHQLLFLIVAKNVSDLKFKTIR